MSLKICKNNLFILIFSLFFFFWFSFHYIFPSNFFKTSLFSFFLFFFKNSPLNKHSIKGYPYLQNKKKKKSIFIQDTYLVIRNALATHKCKSAYFYLVQFELKVHTTKFQKDCHYDSNPKHYSSQSFTHIFFFTQLVSSI